MGTTENRYSDLWGGGRAGPEGKAADYGLCTLPKYEVYQVPSLGGLRSIILVVRNY